MKNLNELNRFRVANVLNQMVGQKEFGDETQGHFMIPHDKTNIILFVVATSHAGWDHVSVSAHNRCPNWIEMCFIKNLFFNDDEVVVQFHPKKEEYVNLAKNCLHLWKCQDKEFPQPVKEMVI